MGQEQCRLLCSRCDVAGFRTIEMSSVLLAVEVTVWSADLDGPRLEQRTPRFNKTTNQKQKKSPGLCLWCLAADQAGGRTGAALPSRAVPDALCPAQVSIFEQVDLKAGARLSSGATAWRDVILLLSARAGCASRHGCAWSRWLAALRRRQERPTRRVGPSRLQVVSDLMWHGRASPLLNSAAHNRGCCSMYDLAGAPLIMQCITK